MRPELPYLVALGSLRFVWPASKIAPEVHFAEYEFRRLSISTANRFAELPELAEFYVLQRGKTGSLRLRKEFNF